MYLRDPPFPFNLCHEGPSRLPCDLELVKHTEQRKWVKRNQRANILSVIKSRILCQRSLIVSIVWIATALVYYGLIIGNVCKELVYIKGKIVFNVLAHHLLLNGDS